MMSKCKRILNKEVAGEGLWQTDLAKCQGQQEGEVFQINPPDQEDDDVDEGDDDDEGDEVEEHRGVAEHSDCEDKDADAEVADATKYTDDEDIDADGELAASTEHSDGEDVDADANMASATEHAEAEEETIKTVGKATVQEEGTKDSVPMADPMEPGGDDDGVVDPQKAPAQIFQLTISLRDDWLHRGDALQDMDLRTYAEFIVRQAKLIRGADMTKILAQPTFALDAHYKLEPEFM